MNILTELEELDASLEDQEDIDQNGGPNDAMRIRQLLALAIPRLSNLVTATGRTVEAFKSISRASGVGATHKARREFENALVAQDIALAHFVAGSEV